MRGHYRKDGVERHVRDIVKCHGVEPDGVDGVKVMVLRMQSRGGAEAGLASSLRCLRPPLVGQAAPCPTLSSRHTLGTTVCPTSSPVSRTCACSR
jgi:hypothetical protein